MSWGYRGYPRYRPPIAGCTTRPVMFTTCPHTHPSAPGGVPPWTPRVVSGGYARGIPPGPPVAPGTGGYPPDPPVRPVSLACGRPTRPTGASPRPLPRGAMWGVCPGVQSLTVGQVGTRAQRRNVPQFAQGGTPPGLFTAGVSLRTPRINPEGEEEGGRRWVVEGVAPGRVPRHRWGQPSGSPVQSPLGLPFCSSATIGWPTGSVSGRSPPHPPLSFDPRGSREAWALGGPKKGLSGTPCGAKPRGGGGAPPTVLILLRNQRSAPRPGRRSTRPASEARPRRSPEVARPTTVVPTTFARTIVAPLARLTTVAPERHERAPASVRPTPNAHAERSGPSSTPHPTPRAPGPISVLRTAEGKSSGRQGPRKRVLADILTP